MLIQKKANEMVRGVVSLPNGTGKNMKVLALVSPDKEEEAKSAGADFVGLDEFIEKIKSGWTDVDVIVTMPSVMGKLGPLGRILGPRGLMPNPKTGTVTMDVGKAVSDVKAGKIDSRHLLLPDEKHAQLMTAWPLGGVGFGDFQHPLGQAPQQPGVNRVGFLAATNG